MFSFLGSLCEVDIDECADVPCVYGNCTNNPGSFDCTCIPGYTG